MIDIIVRYKNGGDTALLKRLDFFGAARGFQHDFFQRLRQPCVEDSWFGWRYVVFIARPATSHRLASLRDGLAMRQHDVGFADLEALRHCLDAPRESLSNAFVDELLRV